MNSELFWQSEIVTMNDERLTINEELFELKIKSEKLKQREESLWLYENDDQAAELRLMVDG